MREENTKSKAGNARQSYTKMTARIAKSMSKINSGKRADADVF
jgi:flagellin-like hook-associated protein FlgL